MINDQIAQYQYWNTQWWRFEDGVESEDLAKAI